jgi:hypothetical protein
VAQRIVSQTQCQSGIFRPQLGETYFHSWASPPDSISGANSLLCIFSALSLTALDVVVNSCRDSLYLRIPLLEKVSIINHEIGERDAGENNEILDNGKKANIMKAMHT